MLKWALIFFIVAAVAGLLGFSEIAGGAAVVAQVLFFVFLAVFIVMLVLALFGGRKV